MRLNGILGNHTDYNQGVVLTFWHGAYSIHGTKIEKTTGKIPVPSSTTWPSSARRKTPQAPSTSSERPLRRPRSG
ncbi:MAG: hypothetical protein H0V56_08035 [Chthoniobacterales bacterium]|nr:hypothetical protein [Chthoniobacterales bacterium]